MKRLAIALLAVAVVALSCTADRTAAPQTTPSATLDDRYRWDEGPEMPTPRTEVAVASIEATIFVAGGFDADGSATDVVEVYDAAEGAWDEAPALPEPLHHAGLAALDRRLFVVGGYRQNGRASARVWSLVPPGTQGADTWRREPDLPTARGALAVAVVGDQMHAVGGAASFGGRSRLSGAHEAFDPARRRWARLPDLPDPRDHLSAAGEAGTLYVAGGRKLSLETNSTRLDVYDPATKRWSRGPDMPTARGGLAAAAASDRVFVFGGEQPQGTFPAAEVFDVRTREWSRAPDLPTPRHGLGATVFGESVYVVGGGPEPGLSVSGVIEVMKIPD